MNIPLQIIRVLSDGRPGHENQSMGLAEALARRTGAEIVKVGWPAGTGLLKRIRMASDAGAGTQLLIGAGHGTHVPLWFAGKRLGAKTVVIMKPSLPTRLFDLCLVPRHDLKRPRDTGHVITTRGALNRIAEVGTDKTSTGVILIGGPSKHHDWAGEPVAAAVRAIVQARPELRWTVGNSRRTPDGFLAQLAGLDAALVPYQETQPGWLPQVLGAAREVWVTEDSVSMIFEAVTAGASVGVLPMPRKSALARPVRAVENLLADGYVRRYADWQLNPLGETISPRLHETSRCADLILQRFFT